MSRQPRCDVCDVKISRCGSLENGVCSGCRRHSQLDSDKRSKRNGYEGCKGCEFSGIPNYKYSSEGLCLGCESTKFPERFSGCFLCGKPHKTQTPVCSFCRQVRLGKLVSFALDVVSIYVKLDWIDAVAKHMKVLPFDPKKSASGHRIRFYLGNGAWTGTFPWYRTAYGDIERSDERVKRLAGKTDDEVAVLVLEFFLHVLGIDLTKEVHMTDETDMDTCDDEFVRFSRD